MTEEQIIRTYGARKIRMTCPICREFLRGPLKRFVLDYPGQTFRLMCPTCMQPFEVPKDEIKYEA